MLFGTFFFSNTGLFCVAGRVHLRFTSGLGIFIICLSLMYIISDFEIHGHFHYVYPLCIKFRISKFTELTCEYGICFCFVASSLLASSVGRDRAVPVGIYIPAVSEVKNLFVTTAIHPLPKLS